MTVGHHLRTKHEGWAPTTLSLVADKFINPSVNACQSGWNIFKKTRQHRFLNVVLSTRCCHYFQPPGHHHPLDSTHRYVHLLVMAGADVQAKTKSTFLPRRFLCFGYLMSWLCIIIRWLFPPKDEWISHWTIVMSTFLLPINICKCPQRISIFWQSIDMRAAKWEWHDKFSIIK